MTGTIGILGLSGNPTHAGHLAMAQHAREMFRLDEVWLMVAPYNTVVKKAYAPYADRVKMAELAALAIDPAGAWLKVSDFEQQIEFPHGQPETIDTLQAFKAHHPDVQPVWIMGSDGLRHFDEWLGWQDIIKSFPSIIYNRGQGWMEIQNDTVTSYLQNHLIETGAFTLQTGQCCWVEEVLSPISSSDIRARLAVDKPAEGVPGVVLTYIQKHGLYKI